MIVHHSGKKKENGPRVHSSLFAAMDSCFFLSSLKACRQLEVTKDRGGELGMKIKFTLTSINSDDDNGNSTVGVTYL